MSDNEWSSDEDNNQLPEQKELIIPESDENSEDEEERAYYLSIIKNKTNYFDLSTLENNNKKQKKNKERKKKEYIDIYTKEFNEPIKKTWVSKRMKDKKTKEGKQSVIKRQFNPRLPLPTLKIFKKEEKNKSFTNDDFPTL
jgi:hypothetical protein